MKYKAAIFDMDGTILNTLEDLAASTNAALQKNGLPARTLGDIRKFVGNGIRRLIERAVPPETDGALVGTVFSDFKAHYAVHCADRTKPYGGIPELLKKLKAAGIRTAVVSNKADFAVQTLAEAYFSGLLDAAAGAKDGARIKPAPDAVNAVLAEFGCAPQDAVYIGDSDVDIQTARNAGTDCISVCWGFRSRAFLLENGARQIAETVAELESLLFQENGSRREGRKLRQGGGEGASFPNQN